MNRVIQRLAWRARASLAPRPRILAYHRVAPTVGADPFGMCVSPDEFAAQLQMLRARYRPLSMQQFLAARTEDRVPRNAVVVTFDDGYADNLFNALPLLERFDVPATFFITASYIGSGREFWWDSLERILATRSERIAAICAAVGLGERPRTPESAYPDVRDRLLEMPATRRDALLAEWRSGAGLDDLSRQSHRILDDDELRMLAAHRLVEIGAHGVDHLDLTRVDAASCRNEIIDSRRLIEARIEQAVRYFAYPFGACDSASEAAVRDAGFEAAFTTEWSPVTRRCSLWQLPRLMTSGSVARLARTLAYTG